MHLSNYSFDTVKKMIQEQFTINNTIVFKIDSSFSKKQRNIGKTRFLAEISAKTGVPVLVNNISNAKMITSYNNKAKTILLSSEDQYGLSQLFVDDSVTFNNLKDLLNVTLFGFVSQITEITSEDTRYMNESFNVSRYSTCKSRKVGSIIVKDNSIVSYGYNGAIHRKCSKDNCLRTDIPSGTRLEECYAIHAEQLAITNLCKTKISPLGATIYVTHFPCSVCANLIVSSGFAKLVYSNNYPDPNSISTDILKRSNIQIKKM